jgi:ribonucleoside-diphosphate reductase alpha chain
MSARERLPDRRDCESIAFESMNMKFTASIGRYPDGRLAELFIDNGKTSSIGVLARDLATTFSIAVQFGADVETIRRSLARDSTGRALGPLGEILDLVLTERP